MVLRSQHQISLPSGTTLAQLIVQLGPELASNVNVLRGVLGRFHISELHAPSDAQNIELFSTYGRLAAEGTPIGDIGLLVQMMGAFVSFSVKISYAQSYTMFSRVPTLTGVKSSSPLSDQNAKVWIWLPSNWSSPSSRTPLTTQTSLLYRVSGRIGTTRCTS